MVNARDTVSFELEDDHVEWLDGIVQAYDFPNKSKAVRVLFDYAIKDVDDDLIFASENSRCLHCD